MSDLEFSFEALERACIDALQSLKTSVSKEADGLSRPNGIFLGERERQAAYREACGLLVRLEAPVEAMRQSIAQLIAGAGASAAHFAQCDPWRAFYEQAVAPFLSCVERAADFEHEGREAEPSSILAACGDFCRLAEAFLIKCTDGRR